MHIEALQIYRNNTHSLTPARLWRSVMNHGCLSIHPSQLVWLSDFTGVCRLQSRMFMALSCHVLCSLLSHSGVKEGNDHVENKIFFLPASSCIRYSGHKSEPQSVASCRFPESSTHFLIVYWCSIDSFQLPHTSGFRSPHRLACWFIIILSLRHTCTNVDNCKINPESPYLRFVSCLSKKGQNSADRGLSNGKKWLLSNMPL